MRGDSRSRCRNSNRHLRRVARDIDCRHEGRPVLTAATEPWHQTEVGRHGHVKTNTIMMRLILIPAIMLILALGAAGVVALVYFVVRASQNKKTAQAGPPQMVLPLSPAPPQDLEQQLRALAKLRDDGVITKEDFDAKKKALLGL